MNKTATADSFYEHSGNSPPPVLTTIPREQIPALIALLATRLLEPEPEQDDQHQTDPLLTADEVAERLSASRQWVYRHADELGGIRLTRKKLRFRESEIERYLRRRRSHG